jgi:hypothetical protein
MTDADRQWVLDNRSLAIELLIDSWWPDSMVEEIREILRGSAAP